MSMQRKSPAAESDLETTAELPVLDVAAYEAAAEERSGSTDTWIMPSPAMREASPEGVAAAATGAKRTQVEVSLHALSENLREVEERLERKGERLAQIEQALAHANAERAAAEQRSKQLTAELEQSRAAVVAAEARIAELLRAVEEREAAVQASRTHDEEFEEKLALRDKALALVQQDLTAAHAVAATYLESLRSAEGRRSIHEEISAALYWEIDERDTRLNTLEGQLSTATARARELEASLNDRSARLAGLEKEVSGLGGTVAQLRETLGDATRTGEDLKRNAGTLSEALAARDERIRALEAAAAQHAGLFTQRQTELERLVAERDTLASSVSSLQARLAEATAQSDERDAAARTAQSRCEELEAANSVQRKRHEQIEAELATVRGELQQRAAALQEAGAERGEHMARIAAGEARAQELEDRMEEQQEFVRVLQADSNASVARVKELEGDLRAAEDMINRLETELRGRSARLDELERSNQEWRSTVEEARHALTDRDSLIRRLEEETANSAVLLGAIRQRLDATGTHEVATEGDKRLLIRAEGDSEIVHVLGRKTSVGRTPDNDLQIDAKFISRHHAVILAGPAHTIIEDLNSTNGVLVNGRRITRQALKDGDAVVIGRTTFRFAVRPLAERKGTGLDLLKVQ
jgi:chromosome segregation ATPase